MSAYPLRDGFRLRGASSGQFASSQDAKLTGERGVALMLVLWLIVLLGFVALGILAKTRGELDLARTERARSVARYAAESGLVSVTSRLRRLVTAAASPEEQARVFINLESLLPELREQNLGTARFQVSVSDLNARLNMNDADEETLFRLFNQFVGEEQARRLASAVEDWKDADDERRPLGAELPDYRSAGSPFVPPNQPMLRVDELTRILGFPAYVANAVAPFVTVRGDGRTNLNTASEPVLIAVGFDPGIAQDLVDRRGRGEVFGSVVAGLDLLRSYGRGGGAVPVRQLTVMPGLLLVISRGWQEGHPLTHEIQAVYQLHGLRAEGGARVDIRHWTERDL